MLSDEQRRRLEREKNSLEQSYELQAEKIASIRNAFLIETDPSRKFQYQQQIKNEETELKRLTDRLDEIEKQLQSAQSLLIIPEKNINYTRLRDLLKEKRWKEADKETFQIILKATTGKEEGDWVQILSIETFPCTDLLTIDQLWKKYSNDRFGFTVQKRIWDSVQKRTLFVPLIDDIASFARDIEIFEKFSDRVGWRKNTLLWKEWLEYNDLTFNTKAPPGHLPTVPGYELREQVRRDCMREGSDLAEGDEFSSDVMFRVCEVFFSRLHDCLD